MLNMYVLETCLHNHTAAGYKAGVTSMLNTPVLTWRMNSRMPLELIVVKQGDSMSLILFKLPVDPLLYKLEAEDVDSNSVWKI